MKFIQQIWNVCLAKIFIWFHLTWFWNETFPHITIIFAMFNSCIIFQTTEKRSLVSVFEALVALHIHHPDRQIGVSALCSDRGNDNAAHGS